MSDKVPSGPPRAGATSAAQDEAYGETASPLRPGTYLLIPPGERGYGYGCMLQFPYVAVHDLRTDRPESDLGRIDASTVLWRLSVRAIGGRDRWPKLGHGPLAAEVAEPVTFFAQDDDVIDSCEIYDTEGKCSHSEITAQRQPFLRTAHDSAVIARPVRP